MQQLDEEGWCQLLLRCAAGMRVEPQVAIRASSWLHQSIDPEQVLAVQGRILQLQMILGVGPTPQLAMKLAFLPLLLLGEEDRIPPDNVLRPHGLRYQSRDHEVDPAPVPVRPVRGQNQSDKLI